MIPDFVICLDCETPCYVFEWQEGRLREALCEVCGNEDPDQFVTEETLDDLDTEEPED